MLDGRSVSRDRLATLLWENVPSNKARHSLSHAIYAIRQVLPDMPIEVFGDDIVLNKEAVTVDAIQYDKLIAAHRLDEALELYRGEFLDGFWLKDCKAFEEWVSHERTLRRDTARAARYSLAQRAEAGGDWLKVIELTTRLLEADPLDEAAMRMRSISIAATHGKDSALRDLRRFIERLETDFGCQPERATKDLVAHLSSSDVIGVASANASEPAEQVVFVGRQKDFEKLRRAWEAVKGSVCRVVRVAGEPGIGKTRLCERFLRLAAIQGARVFQSSCYPTDIQLPYSAIVNCITSDLSISDVRGLPNAWSAALAELLPEYYDEQVRASDPAVLDANSARRRLFDAFCGMLQRIVHDRPAVLFIDDFQWADESSIALIHYVVRKLMNHPVMILLAMRTDDQITGRHATAHGNIFPYGFVETIALQELEQADVDSLIAACEQKERYCCPESLKHFIHERIGGRPFFIIEMIKALGSGSIKWDTGPISTGVFDRTTIDLPSSIEELLISQIQPVSEDANTVLGVLAVLGRKAPIWLIQQVTALDGVRLMRGLDELLARGIIREQEAEVAFCHDLIREATYRTMSGVRRRYLHGTAADTLSSWSHVPAATIAFHYDLAGNRAMAQQYALLAADQSQKVHAYNEAEYYLRMALANADTIEKQVSTKERLALLLYDTRRYLEAEVMYNSLCLDYDRVADVKSSLRCKTMLAAIGSKMGSTPVEELVDRLRRLRALAEPLGDSETLIRVMILLCKTAHDAGDRATVIEVAERLARLAREIEANRTAVEALTIAANAIGFYQNVDRAMSYVADAVELANRIDDALARVATLMSRAINRLQAGELSGAKDDFLLARDLAEKEAALSWQQAVLSNYGVLLLEIGDYAGAKSVLDEALQFATDAGAAQERLVVVGNLLLLEYEQGRIYEAVDLAHEVLAIGQRVPAWWCTVGAWSILGLCALERGRFAEANQCRREVLLRFEGRDFWVSDVSYAEMFLARLAAMEGEVENALARLERAITAYEGRDVFCLSRLQLERARLLVDRDSGEAWRLAGAVRTRAKEMGARPLVAKADAILDRVPTPGV